MPSKIRGFKFKTDRKEYYVGENVQLNNVFSLSRHEKELCPCYRSRRHTRQQKRTQETCIGTLCSVDRASRFSSCK
jgi:hypothetical protein